MAHVPDRTRTPGPSHSSAVRTALLGGWGKPLRLPQVDPRGLLVMASEAWMPAPGPAVVCCPWGC